MRALPRRTPSSVERAAAPAARVSRPAARLERGGRASRPRSSCSSRWPSGSAGWPPTTSTTSTSYLPGPGQAGHAAAVLGRRGRRRQRIHGGRGAPHRRLRLRASRRASTARTRGGALTVTSGCPRIVVGSCSASYEVAAPETATVDVRTTSGNVRLDGLPRQRERPHRLGQRRSPTPTAASASRR